MEGIIDIEKTPEDIERCKKIVVKVVGNRLSETLLEAVTIDIMDTAISIGGDFSDDNIESIARQYVINGGIERVKKRHGGI